MFLYFLSLIRLLSVFYVHWERHLHVFKSPFFLQVQKVIIIQLFRVPHEHIYILMITSVVFQVMLSSFAWFHGFLLLFQELLEFHFPGILFLFGISSTWRTRISKGATFSQLWFPYFKKKKWTREEVQSFSSHNQITQGKFVTFLLYWAPNPACHMLFPHVFP